MWTDNSNGVERLESRPPPPPHGNSTNTACNVQNVGSLMFMAGNGDLSIEKWKWKLNFEFEFWICRRFGQSCRLFGERHDGREWSFTSVDGRRELIFWFILPCFLTHRSCTVMKGKHKSLCQSCREVLFTKKKKREDKPLTWDAVLPLCFIICYWFQILPYHH